MGELMSERPLFLLSNDDGIHAPGIHALYEAIKPLGNVVVVAPHVEQSATSQSITIAKPLRVEKLKENFYAIEGTPADCVLFGMNEILGRKPDWVLAGINRGANLGLDTLYSGTVGAALEGVLQGVRAMAVSSHGTSFDSLKYETAGRIARMLIENEAELVGSHEGLINLNVPSIDFSEVKGIKAATLGRRVYEEYFIKGYDPRGRDYYWLGGTDFKFTGAEDSDCVIIDQGYATVSFLRPSLLDEKVNEKLAEDVDRLMVNGFWK